MAAMAKGTKMKVRKGDNVVVLAGKDKGKTGEVLRAWPKKQRVLVQRVNMVKRHMRASTAQTAGTPLTLFDSSRKRSVPPTYRIFRVGSKFFIISPAFLFDSGKITSY